MRTRYNWFARLAGHSTLDLAARYWCQVQELRVLYLIYFQTQIFFIFCNKFSQPLLNLFSFSFLELITKYYLLCYYLLRENKKNKYTSIVVSVI